MSNNCCRKNICNVCTPKQRYCGEDLDCINVVKGDTYDTALQSINDILCDQNCCDPLLEQVTWALTDIQIGVGEWTSFNSLDINVPTYIVTKQGKYKVTINTTTTTEDSSCKIIYGIGVNNNLPDFSSGVEQNSNTTKQTIAIGNETSLDFILDFQVGDVVRAYFKVISNTLNVDGYHKLIFQKI